MEEFDFERKTRTVGEKRKTIGKSIGYTAQNKAITHKTFSRSIKIDRERYYFEYTNQIIVVGVLIALYFCYKLLFFQSAFGRARRLTSLTKTCILGMESYASFFNLHNAAFQVMLWNNTSPIWNTEALEIYEYFKDLTKNKLIANFTEALDYDLGNYTAKYRNDLLKVKACGNVFLSLEPHLCNESYAGVVNSNLLTSMNGIIDILEDFIRNWQVIRHDWGKVKQMLSTKTFRSIWAKADSMIFDLYYFIVLEITKTIVDETGSNIKDQISIEQYIGGLFIAWGIIVLRVLWKGILLRSITINRALSITPTRLWKGNARIVRP